MSEAEEADLSGRWCGFFNYPSRLPTTEFDVELRDVSGLLSGLTTEPHFNGTGTILNAVIEGEREGGLVRFRKTYDDFEFTDVVHYEGHLDAAGDEISGEWEIRGHWSGTFLMIRASKTGAKIARKAEEKV
ncbi:MAG: hypothetical protein ACXWUN_04000 [Allosphingosinicella sp.]